MTTNRFLPFLLALLLALPAAGLRAQTAAEPTVHQIYQKADSGDLRGARAMIDEVLAHHPNSAKAHYVKAELAARGGDAATAAGELQAAEKLAPGLPFAKPEAVSALRAQLQRPAAGARSPSGAGAAAFQPAAVPSPGGGIPWGAVLLAGLAALGVVLWLRRPANLAPAAAAPNPYARDDAFGRPDALPAGATPMPTGPAPQPGMASSMMRGLGTGLAVGAGVVAAEEIGRRLFDHGAANAGVPQGPGFGGAASAADSQIARDAGIDAFDPGANRDMGGQDFGIVDGGGWDDGGAGDVGGNDWDS